MKHLLILILVGSAASGCAGKIFQPPRPSFLTWTAPGKSVVDVKKKLLECGMPEPSGLSYTELDWNARKSMSLCMVHAGFHRPEDYLICDHQEERRLPVCESGAEIPTPSVSRRLNGYYCKAKTDYQYCKQNARYPDGCDNNNYDDPVPECLP